MFCEKIYRYVNITWQLLTRKHLSWSLFLILSIAKFFRAHILKNICKRLLLKMCLLKLFIKRINFTLKNPEFFNISIRNKWKYLLLFHDRFPVKFEFIHIQYYFGMVGNRSSHQRCSVEEGVLRNFAKSLGKHLCNSLFFNKVASLKKKETLTRVFSCEFCKIFKNTFNRSPLDDYFVRNKL